MSDGIHAGHRERVKQDFLDNGFNENTDPLKVLELLLFYSIPQRDTNPIAHELLNRFRDLPGVLDASEQELLEMPFITKNSVVLFKMIAPVARMYCSSKYKNRYIFQDFDEVGDFLQSKYIGYNNEVLSILCLDNVGRFISFDILEKGDISSVGVSTRTVIELVLRRQANCAILAHNHPAGYALPSSADVELTETISEALSHVSVRLCDHVILAGDDYVSMAQSKEYHNIFKW